MEISTHITIGNGEHIVADGKGETNILSFNFSQLVRKRIVDVLFVPEIPLNLFSSGKAMDCGYKLRSDNKRWELLKNENSFAVGVRRDRLFQMIFKVEISVEVIINVAVTKLSLQVWPHGHQYISHVKKFLQENEISFVNKDFSCETFTENIIVEVSKYQRQNQQRGPMQTSSIVGSKYFLLIKDRFSHFRFVYFLKQKSEIAAKVKIDTNCGVFDQTTVWSSSIWSYEHYLQKCLLNTNEQYRTVHARTE